MSNEIFKERSWLKRNRIWFVPVSAAVFMFVLIFASSDVVNHAVDFASGYNDKALYENAVNRCNENKDVLNVLGKLEPVDNMAILESDISHGIDKESLHLTVRVKGIKGKGRMDVQAVKHENTWQYSIIKVRIKDPEQEIIVVE